MGCEYTLLSKLTSSSAATPPDLGGEIRKADCKSLLFHKTTFARRESRTPAFEALLTPGRATATVLHVAQLSAPSIPPQPLPCQFQSLPLNWDWRHFLPPKAAGRVREAVRDGDCPLCTTAPEDSPCL